MGELADGRGIFIAKEFGANRVTVLAYIWLQLLWHRYPRAPENIIRAARQRSFHWQAKEPGYVIKPDRAVRSPVIEVWGWGFGATSRREDVSDIAISVAETDEVVILWSRSAGAQGSQTKEDCCRRSPNSISHFSLRSHWLCLHFKLRWLTGWACRFSIPRTSAIGSPAICLCVTEVACARSPELAISAAGLG